MSNALMDKPALNQFRQAKETMKEQLQDEHQKLLNNIQEVDQWFEDTNTDLKKMGIDFETILKINIMGEIPNIETKKDHNENEDISLSEEEELIFRYADNKKDAFTYTEFLEHVKDEQKASVYTQALVHLIHLGLIKEFQNESEERKFIIIKPNQ